MRTAELTTYTSRLNGGVFYALSALLPEMARSSAGDELKVFGYADRHTEDDREAWRPLEVEAIRPWPPRHFGFSPRFYPALASYGPDLMHVHGLWTYLSSAALRMHRRKGTPAIVSPHGMLDPWALGFSRSRKRVAAALFQDRLLGSASVLHALNTSEAQSIRAYGLTNPIAVIPNGVSLPVVAASSPPWSVADGERVLLFLGRIHPKKGLDMLINAWLKLKDRPNGHSRWHLVLAGWDEIGHEPELRRLVAAGGIGGTVEFVGPLFGAKKASALAHADGFVLPSRSEGLPMAVLEAWSHGKPVLMTTACNLPEGEAEGASITVDPSDIGVEAGLVRFLSLGGDELRRMGAAGRRLVERRFTWSRIATDMARLYRAIGSREAVPADLLYHGPPDRTR